MNNNKVYYFQLSVSYTECEALYQPSLKNVIMTADSGHRVQIPTSRLRPFVTSLGLKGYFRLTISPQNKILLFERLH